LQGIRQEINNNLLKRSKFNLEKHERKTLIVSESLKTPKKKEKKGISKVLKLNLREFEEDHQLDATFRTKRAILP